MLALLFIITIILLSIELSYVGKVMGFIQDKFAITDLSKLFLSSFIVFLFITIGYILSLFLTSILHNKEWYASTIIFILGIKLFYDGIKLHKAKQLINTNNISGLIISSILIGLNSFFIGVSFGLIDINRSLIITSLGVLFAGAILGYATGLKLKKLNPHRFEFFIGIVYIVVAILLIVEL